MKRDLYRIRIHSDEELRAQLDELGRDRTPRLIQDEDGTVIAVLLHPDDFAEVTGIPKSRINRDRLLSLIGTWNDIDADELITDIYRWRDEAPQSPDPSLYFEDDEPETKEQ
jgi:hypothetical protein